MGIGNGRNGFNCIDYPEDSCTNFGNIYLEAVDPRDSTPEDTALFDGKGTFDFCFMYSDTEEYATVDSFDWTVFDLDQRITGELERFSIDTSQAVSTTVSSNSELKMWCEDEGPASAVKSGEFTYDYIDNDELPATRTGPHYLLPSCNDGVRTVFHSRYAGFSSDNPTDPTSLTDIALARAINFQFEDTFCWTVEYEVYCPCGEGNYCDEEGGYSDAGEVCTGGARGICPTTGNKFDPAFPNACKGYNNAQFLFSSNADARLSEEGECITPAPFSSAPTMAPSKTPTTVPTKVPTNAPTKAPTNAPTIAPVSDGGVNECPEDIKLFKRTG